MGATGLRQRADEFLEFYGKNLVCHFRAEEDVLFPSLQAAVPQSAALIDELLRQHDQIRRAMPQLEAGTGLAKLIFDLGDLLEAHIRKEERELFPLFEKNMEPHQAEAIGAELKNIIECRESE
jgi:iron-sulfur cluster repair protein YtfE (RIC family)